MSPLTALSQGRVCFERACRARSADLQSISICPNRRGPREFSGARPCAEHQPQHGGNSNRDALRLGLRPQPRSVLVAAPPRCAVSQVFNLRTAVCEQRSADYKSAIRQIKNLRYANRMRGEGRAFAAPTRLRPRRQGEVKPLNAAYPGDSSIFRRRLNSHEQSEAIQSQLA
jgi:hypothetical protein